MGLAIPLSKRNRSDFTADGQPYLSVDHLYTPDSLMKRTFCLISLRKTWLFLFFCWLPLFSALQALPPAEESAQLESEYLKKGEDHFFARRFGAALQWFRRALEINPDNALAHAYTGDILLSLGEPDEALKHFRVAAELKSNPAPEYFRIGQIYYLKQEREEAERYFKRALKADESLVEAHFYLGLLSYRMGRNRAETLKHLKAFRSARPDFSDREALDRAIALLEDPDAPLDQHRDLITIDPLRLFYRKDSNDTETAEKTAEAQPEKQSEEERVQPQKRPDVTVQKPSPDLQKPVTQDYRDGFLSVASGPGSLFNQALVFRDENPDRALAILAEAIEQDPRDARLHSLRCEILFRHKKDLQEARRSCEKAAGLEPTFRHLQNLGRIQEAEGKPSEAYASYVKALDGNMDPDLAIHAIKIGETLPGKEQETRSLLERMLARRPDHREGLLTLMQRQKDDRNRVGLRTTMERLQSLYGDDIDVLERMAMILLSDPETEDEAVELLRRYYNHRPEDLRAGLSLAGLYLKRGQEKEALVLLAELYESHPESYDVVRTILILFMRRNQNLDSAETMARKFLNSGAPEEQKKAILDLLPEDMKNRLAPTPEPSKQPVPLNTPVQP